MKKFFYSPVAMGLLTVLAGCSTNQEPVAPGSSTAGPAVVQVENVTYKVGARGGRINFGCGDDESESTKWEKFGLITNKIRVQASEHMECAAAVRDELKVESQWGSFTNSPADLVAMKKSTVVSGLAQHYDWGGARVDRSWKDEDFNAAFAHARNVVDYALANMNEKGVCIVDIKGETYVYKLLNTDLQWGCPVGTQLGEYGREFADVNRHKGNRVTYIVTEDIFIEGSQVSGNVYAPDAVITMRTGASIAGQVICDRFVVDCPYPCELHNPGSEVRGITPDPTRSYGPGRDDDDDDDDDHDGDRDDDDDDDHDGDRDDDDDDDHDGDRDDDDDDHDGDRDDDDDDHDGDRDDDDDDHDGDRDDDDDDHDGDRDDDDDAIVSIPLDINREYLVQPDDFAIHNGDKLYVDIANGDSDPATQTALAKPYLVISARENPTIFIDNVDEMYREFVGKTELCNDHKSPYFGQQVPYIAEDGTFTLEAFLWPGTKSVNAEGREIILPLDYTELGFESLQQAVDGCYIIGSPTHGSLISKPDDDYSIIVSAFKAIQGVGNTPYVHVSIHIRPNSK